MKRPLGITILAILKGVLSLPLVVGGGYALLFRDQIVEQFAANPDMPAEAGFVSAFGIIVLVLGLVGLLIAWGLFSLKRWAWYVTIGLQALNAVMAVFSLATGQGFGQVAVNLGIAGIIIWYLLTPRVKAAFGIGAPAGTGI